MVTFHINGQELQAEEGTTILAAARSAGIRIPTLCYLKDYTPGSSCRMCLVEVKGARNPMTACNTVVTEGMEIETETESVRTLRKQNLMLIASNHRMDCTYCNRFPYCELNALMREYGLDDRTYRYCRPEEYDTSALHLVRDNSKCILCGRCVAACEKQGIRAIGLTHRGSWTRVTPGADCLPLPETGCIGCGQCILACPVGALREADDTQPVLNELHHKKKHVWVGVTPEVTALLGECMQEEAGTLEEGRTVALLRKLGFEKVFDLGIFAELASVQEKKELEQRLEEQRNLPMISAGCSGMVNYIRKHYPELTPLLSECGSQMQCFAEYCRETEAKRAGVAPEDIYVVVISSCTAAKAAGYPGIDASLTVRELSTMFRRSCVSDFTAMQVWSRLEDEAYDEVAGEVRAAAVSEDSDGKGAVSCVRVSDIPAAQVLLEQIAAEKAGALEGRAFDYLKAGACKEGCLCGGGSPRVFAEQMEEGSYLAKRKLALKICE